MSELELGRPVVEFELRKSPRFGQVFMPIDHYEDTCQDVARKLKLTHALSKPVASLKCPQIMTRSVDD